MRSGMSSDEIFELTKFDPWFLFNVKQIIDFDMMLNDTAKSSSGKIPNDLIEEAKSYGFSNKRIASIFEVEEKDVREQRKNMGLKAVYKMVDTCAAEFSAFTPYLYSTYEKPFYTVTSDALRVTSIKNDSDPSPVTRHPSPSVQCEANPTDRKKVIILGSGPNRIGQGIEFDYCCVHAVYALQELGYETIMVNCNPETVSTDYDTADRLYFEPLTLEDVLNIIDTEKPEGVIVQLGGQTPLKLAVPLEKEGVKILGTSPDSIDRAED